MFDLNAVVAEGSVEPFRFMWGDRQFELPALLDLPVERQIAAIEGIERLQAESVDPKQIVDVLHLVLGETTLADLSAIKPLPARAMMALIEAWMNYQGADLGKSSASSASSANTAPKSKPTSRSGRGHKTS